MNPKLIELYEKNQEILATIRRKKWQDINNLPEFSRYYFPHIFENETPEFHKEIFELLKNSRLGIGAPRGFAKSTIVQKMYGVWLLMNRPNADILSISNSQDLAQEFVRFIKIELSTNEKLLSDYADLQWGENISNKWTESHISIDKNRKLYSQMRAKGRGCQVRGFRPTHILCDDLEDDELVRSEDRRKELKQWFLSALLRTIKKEQQLVVIGTKLHPLALLTDILDNKEYFHDWTTRTFKALETKNGKECSIWEDRFSTKWLLAERKKDLYSFQAEYQNDPLAGTEQLFRKEWLDKAKDHYPQEIPPLKCLVIAIDPAISTKEYADNTAFCVVGLDADGLVYELETRAGKFGTWQFIEEFWKIYNKYFQIYKYLVPEVVIETFAFQQVYEKLLKESARQKSIFLNIRQVDLGTSNDKRPKDKFSRALSTTHFFEQERIFLKTYELYEELMLFPTGSHDDRVDAFVYALNRIHRRAGNAIIKNPTQFKQMELGVQPPDYLEWLKKKEQFKDWRTI